VVWRRAETAGVNNSDDPGEIHMSTSTAVAFTIERLRSDYFVPVLVDGNGYEFFRLSTCRCADQAAAAATRCGTRPLFFAGMFETRRGERVEITDGSCTVRRSDWTWQHHGHTHGSLARSVRAVALSS
jgi:hypothetical protein